MTTTEVTPTLDTEPRTVTPRTSHAFAIPLAVFGGGLAEVLIALANQAGRGEHPSVAGACFWAGIVLLYVPTSLAAWRLRNDARALRFLAGLLAVSTYLVRILETPTQLATVDELQTLRSLRDVATTHHLFAVNPMVGAYSRFPGSQVAIVAVHQLTGLDLSTAGKMVIGFDHLVLVLALFALFRRVLGNAFAAFAAAAVYTTNSSFMFFDTQVAYESFTLPLAVAAVYLVAAAVRAAGRRQAAALSITATVVGAVVCVAHHMTSYWLAAVLVTWTAAAGLHRRRHGATPVVVVLLPAAVVTTVAVLWYALVAHAQLHHELGPVFSGSLSAVRSALRGDTALKQPFTATGTAAGENPVGLQIVGYASVALSLLLLGAGLVRLARRPHLRTPLPVTLGLLGLVYPVGLLLRLTRASTETSSRTVEFTFLGVALAVGVLVAAPPLRSRRARHRLPRHRWLAPAGLVLLAVGGLVVGEAPYDRYAGPYLVQADTRSVTRPGQQAAAWAAAHWPAGSRFAATDVTSALLVAAAGTFTPQTGVVGRLPVLYLFDSPTVDLRAAHIVQVDKIDYLVVDRRVTTTPSPVLTWPMPAAVGPVTGSSPTLPEAYLAKFQKTPGLDRQYDNGVVVVYALPARNG